MPWTPREAKAPASVYNDDDVDKPAETAVCAFVANNLHKGGNLGSWKPLQQGLKKREKKEPRRVGDLPLSSEELMRAQPQGCFVCYGQNFPFQQEHRTYSTHKADNQPCKKAPGSKKLALANIRESKVEESKEELSKLKDTLAKQIQEIKRARVPQQDKDRDKHKDKKGKGRWENKGDVVTEVTPEENTPTNDTASRSRCSQGPQLGRLQHGAVVAPAPFKSEIVDSPGRPFSGMPGTMLEGTNSRNGWVRASAGGVTALGGSSHPTKVHGEGTNRCTQSSFTTTNVFDVLKDLSESMAGSPRPHLDAVDGQAKPITHTCTNSWCSSWKGRRSSACKPCAELIATGRPTNQKWKLSRGGPQGSKNVSYMPL